MRFNRLEGKLIGKERHWSEVSERGKIKITHHTHHHRPPRRFVVVQLKRGTRDSRPTFLASRVAPQTPLRHLLRAEARQGEKERVIVHHVSEGSQPTNPRSWYLGAELHGQSSLDYERGSFRRFILCGTPKPARSTLLVGSTQVDSNCSRLARLRRKSRDIWGKSHKYHQLGGVFFTRNSESLATFRAINLCRLTRARQPGPPHPYHFAH